MSSFFAFGAKHMHQWPWILVQNKNNQPFFVKQKQNNISIFFEKKNSVWTNFDGYGPKKSILSYFRFALPQTCKNNMKFYLFFFFSAKKQGIFFSFSKTHLICQKTRLWDTLIESFKKKPFSEISGQNLWNKHSKKSKSYTNFKKSSETIYWILLALKVIYSQKMFWALYLFPTQIKN